MCVLITYLPLLKPGCPWRMWLMYSSKTKLHCLLAVLWDRYVTLSPFAIKVMMLLLLFCYLYIGTHVCVFEEPTLRPSLPSLSTPLEFVTPCQALKNLSLGLYSFCTLKLLLFLRVSISMWPKIH